MSLQLVSEFKPSWTIFWATTFTFDLGFLDEFLFRRLGNPPLNATVLADFTHFAKAWGNVQPSDDVSLRRVNRDYLLRGVAPSDGAFHPKTYFLGNAREGVLLVGFGNLRLEGMDQGREVFCRFSPDDETGLAAIRAWREWMGRLVDLVDDQQVAARWRDLNQQAMWIQGKQVPSCFVTNLDASLFDQFIEQVELPVDELHLLAPFFDPDAEAMRRLIAATRPRLVNLYVTPGMSADGDQLRDVLANAESEVHLLSFDDDAYVHAKMYGAITGERGVLLSGSANASRAALLTTFRTTNWANFEAGSLIQVDAASVREAFCPPGLQVRELTIDALSGVQLIQDDVPGDIASIRLFSATGQADGTVALRFAPDWPDKLALCCERGCALISGRTSTLDVEAVEGGATVWIADLDGVPLSNRVPVDDPERLQSWLKERVDVSDRPRELAPEDYETPIGRLLERLNREYIFDIDDTAAAQGAARYAGAENQDSDSVDFWERFVAEELQLDPRAARYERYAIPAELRLGYEDDDLLSLMRSMLSRVPDDRLSYQSIHADATGMASTGQSWTPTRRLQVRLENVLRRWCRGLADPRLAWLGPNAVVHNFNALVTTLEAFCEAWSEAYLREEQLVRVAEDLFSSFVTGSFLRLDGREQQDVLKELASSPSIAAALAYIALRTGNGWKQHVFDWQPFLKVAFEFGMVQANENSATLVESVTGEKVSTTRIEERLRRAATYTTDERWETQIEAELGLERVEISLNPAGHRHFPIQLEVWGVADPLTNPALVSLVRRTFGYRTDPGVMVAFPDRARRDRMTFSRTGAAYAVVDGVEYECDGCAIDALMELLEQQHAGWGELMLRAVY